VQGPPCAGEVGFLLAHEYRPGDTDQEGRKRAVIATDYIYNFSHR
jgi:hypothetical protein